MTEKVLLVDDEMDFLDVMRERMAARNIEVETSMSAKDALEKIKTSAYDAIVLDLMMPEMDGMEALKAIKTIRPEAQVILLTGHGSVQKGVEAMKLGAMDFVEKPANIEELTRMIQEAHAKTEVISEVKQQERINDILKRVGF